MKINILKMILVELLLIFIIFVQESQAIELPKSKIATNLNSDFDTQITLSINENFEEEKIVDIVLVLDVSMLSDSLGSNLINESYKLIEDLNSQENLKANIAMVIFSNGSKQIMGLTDSTQITSSSYLSNKLYNFSNLMWIYSNSTGSNLQSGLLMAKNILDNSTTGSKPENRHVIVSTDGGNYTYNNSNGETSTTIYKTESGAYMNIGNGDSSGDFGSTSRETKLVKYYEETGDYEKAFDKLMQEGLSIEEHASRGYKWKDTNKTKIEQLASDGKLTIYSSVDEITNLEKYPYTNLEVGTYSAAKVLKDMKDENYNIYTIGYLYSYGFDDNGNITNRLFALPTKGFLKWTENVGKLYFKESTSINLSELIEIFSDINSQIIQDIDEDTYLIDQMGFGIYDDGTDYDFDFVNNIEKIDVFVKDEQLDKEIIEENKYGFGKDDSLANGYKIILTYYPTGIDGSTDKECFKLDFNYNINEGIQVKVQYHEFLKQEFRKTKYGIYGQYDEDGSKNYDGLKANDSAKLYLANGKEEIFNIPTLSYEIERKAYNININETVNCSVNTDKENSVLEDDAVKVNLTPEDGCSFESLKIIDSDGNEIEYENLGEDIYSFIMPNNDVEINASYKKIEENSDNVETKSDDETEIIEDKNLVQNNEENNSNNSDSEEKILDTENESSKILNSKTGDEISIYLGVFLIAFLGYWIIKKIRKNH